MGTAMHAEHGVDQDQFEPGVPEEQQAHLHAVDYVLADVYVNAMLGFTERFAAEVQLPYRMIRQRPYFYGAYGRRFSGFSSIHHRDETISGVGDVTLVGRYRLASPETLVGWTLDVRGGPALPTGNTEPNPFALAREGKPHQHMFFGNGTVDPVVGVEASYAFPSFRLLSGGSVRAPLYENSFGYRGSTQFSAALGVEAGFGLRSWRFLMQPGLYHETPATWSGESARNSGRMDIVLGGGVFWSPSPALTVHVTTNAPRTVQAEGGQLEIPFVAAFGVVYAFDLWSESS